MLPDNAALIVIDVQRGFDNLSWGDRNNPAAERNVARLIDAWRRTERPVIHIQHSSLSPTGEFFEGTSGYEPKPEAVPAAGEPIYVKHVNSSFIGTTLERDLRARGIETLVLAGLTTNHCVSTTARMAGNLGFETYVVEDATAAFARAALDGSTRSAAEVHAAALSDISGEFAIITNTEGVIAELGAGT